MTLGDYIKDYREQHGLSQRAFADLAEISNQYVSLLEKGVNNDGKPLSPKMSMYSKISEAIGIPLNELLSVTSGTVSISENPNQKLNNASLSISQIKDWLINSATKEDLLEFIQIAANELNK